MTVKAFECDCRRAGAWSDTDGVSVAMYRPRAGIRARHTAPEAMIAAARSRLWLWRDAEDSLGTR
jgi:hypothetical protein